MSELRTHAVLLDVGGIFHLPDHTAILGAFRRGGFDVDVETFDRAHYAGAATFVDEPESRDEWRDSWGRYLDAYVAACGVTAEQYDDVIEHVRSEFASGALWQRVIPGSVEGLRALQETGVRLGVISNADGLVAQRLAEQEILQVGPGLGIEVECIIDSGLVGIEKPDPKIFHLALDAMGLAPDDAWYVGDTPGIDITGARAAGMRGLLMDPYGFHPDGSFECVGSLHDVAALARGESLASS